MDEALRAKAIPGLEDNTNRVLVHLFREDGREARYESTMVRLLAMERNFLQYHLEQLHQAGLADKESGKYVLGHVCWALTAAGRKYVVERKLI